MQDDIAKTLRDWADSAYEQGVENMIAGLWDAANEIEKLRAEVDRLKRRDAMSDDIVTRLRRDSQYMIAWPIVEEAADEIERLRAELNKTHAHYAHLLMQFVSEANAARRSTAPTPANTGGGADHQIPEAL